jgi:hypothetical protein
MLRDAHIPLLLWLPAALLVHLLGGGSAFYAADLAQQRAQILAFSRAISQKLGGDQAPVEIEVFDLPTPPEEPATPEVAKQPSVAESGNPDPDSPASPPELSPATAKQAHETPPEDEHPAPPEPAPKKEKAPKLPATSEPYKPGSKPLIVQAVPDGRLAIINDPDTKKDQADNPGARRIADEANHTDRERMARLRAYDQNSSKPRPAGGDAKAPPEKPGGGDPGDGDPGDGDPGDGDTDEPGFSTHKPDEDDSKAARAGSERGPAEPAATPSKRDLDTPRTPGQAAQRATPGRKAETGGKGKHTPKVATGDGGTWRIDPSGGDGRQKKRARKAKRGRSARPFVPGTRGAELPKRFRVDAHGVREALGEAHLKRDQERARNTRMAKHRGRFAAADFKRFRAAIENYDPSVELGNQTSLNAARVPFASYINRMHNRIHPIFADGFLRSIEGLGRRHGLSNMKLVTHLELVLDREAGKLIRFGVVKPSGVTAFEVAALRSVEQAAPFGKPPKSIVSSDGKIYIHWEFYRNPYYACTSRFARPFLLKHPPDLPAGPRRKLPKPVEPPSEGERYGWLLR